MKAGYWYRPGLLSKEDEMGSVVAFTPCRSSGGPRPSRKMPDRPAEVIILPVVRFVRPGAVPGLDSEPPAETL